MKAVLNPYLIFNGNCAKAMKFYQSILGGKLTMSTYAESGATQYKDAQDKIIHAKLDNDLLTFMASDDNEAQKVVSGTNVQMSISGDSTETLTKYFNKLAAGGKVFLPLSKQFWGDTFGMLTDKFRIHWMVNITGKKYLQLQIHFQNYII